MNNTSAHINLILTTFVFSILFLLLTLFIKPVFALNYIPNYPNGPATCTPDSGPNCVTASNLSDCTTLGGLTQNNYCNTSTWTFTYAYACQVCGATFGLCSFSYQYQYQTCNVTDSCTNVWPYLNPGICSASSYNGINPTSACVIGGTVYKTCCNSSSLDGACWGGSYTGTCPSGTTTVICGVSSCSGISAPCTTQACGTSACQAIFPLPTPTPTPISVIGLLGSESCSGSTSIVNLGWNEVPSPSTGTNIFIFKNNIFAGSVSYPTQTWSWNADTQNANYNWYVQDQFNGATSNTINMTTQICAGPTPTVTLTPTPTPTPAPGTINLGVTAPICPGPNIKLDWTTTTSDTQFNILEDGVPITSVTGTTWTSGVVTAGQSHDWRVTGIQTGTLSNIKTVVTPPCPTPTPTTAPTPTPPPGALPDLVVDSPITINGTLVVGQTLSFTATARNIGGAATGADSGGIGFGIDIAQGNPNQNLGVPGTGQILAGGTLSATSGNWIATVGSHTMWACADYWNYVVESNETNNCTSRTFTVAAVTTPTPTSTPTPVPCQVTTSPSVLNLTVGGATGTVTASVTSGLGSATISQMRFGSYNTSIATVNPTSDSSSPYSTTVTAVTGGATAVWGTADLSDGRTCQSTGATDTNINVTYTISGNVFVDNGIGVGGIAKDGIKNGTEANYTGAITITSSPTETVIAPVGAGTFTVSNLPAGPYTISYINVPSGDYPTFPTSSPPSLGVVVGSSCTNLFPHYSCSSGNIINLNFGIAPYGPWIQSTRTDIRLDNGYNYYIPAGASCLSYASLNGGGVSNGIIFTGDTSASFGGGNAGQTTNWVVGGSTAELFAPTKGNVIRTSYNYVNAQIKQAGLTATSLTTTQCGAGGTASCVLSTTTLPNGLYIANGNLTLSGASYTFPANKNYVILVNGNLTINSQIHVPNGSTVTFIVSGDIIVDPTVGETITTSASPDIEGFYSTDKNFITGSGSRRLNIAGSVVVNAGLTGGTFQLQRDLAAGNANCPAFSIQERPDFILNAPDIIRYQNTIYQEVAP